MQGAKHPCATCGRLTGRLAEVCMPCQEEAAYAREMSQAPKPDRRRMKPEYIAPVRQPVVVTVHGKRVEFEVVFDGR